MRNLHPLVRVSRLVCLFVVISTPLVMTAYYDDQIKEAVRFLINFTKKFFLYALPQIKKGPVKTTMGNMLFFLNQDLFLDDLPATDLLKLSFSLFRNLTVLTSGLEDVKDSARFSSRQGFLEDSPRLKELRRSK
ncbi:hypothetical protein RRG08_053005 [Elysia crispata]|uniref:Uncharacterized protein n=1 Tax=Elysia crispata TaxID=231223 RepID=A0AAE1CYK1_9GAST|nr:hypothetical protein RRG08_053005 [Elysia crispata]